MGRWAIRKTGDDGSFAARAGRNQLPCVGSTCSHPSGATSDPKEIFAMLEAQPTVVSLTDSAAAKLAELTKEETNPDIGLRVYVYSGGCSGYRYGMMLEDQPTAEDSVLAANGVRVYIDNNSIPLIQGSEIDYVDTLMGAGFTVNNPNAVSGCGCGSSFRTADDAGTARSCAH
jgi:iron-sulfur cluster assembly accessory protein